MIELDAYCYQSKSASSNFSADFLTAPATSRAFTSGWYVKIILQNDGRPVKENC
jgi:hypothetical protein